MNIKILLVTLFLCSCSTMKKTKIYSGVAGGLLGGLVGSAVGKELSPNAESDNFNQNLGAGVGIAIGALGGVSLGKSFYEEDPENFKGEPIDIDYKQTPGKKNELVPLNNQQINLGDLGIKLDAVSPVAYKAEVTKELPKKYQGDVYKQVVIKHKIPTRKIKLKDGRSYILKETELIEHKFVE